MTKDPVKIGRINTRIEKAIDYDFGDNIFCYITEDTLREFVAKWPKDYLRKVEEASNIIKDPHYVGIDEEGRLLYFIKDYLVKNQCFRKACIIMDFSRQLNLRNIISFDDKKMVELAKTTKFYPIRS